MGWLNYYKPENYREKLGLRKEWDDERSVDGERERTDAEVDDDTAVK